MMKIVSIATSKKKGTRKTPVEEAFISKDHGLEGDAHAGSWHRQVSFLSAESINEARRQGLEVTFGDFAENIATTGIDWKTIPVGTRVRLGDTVVVEITQIQPTYATGVVIEAYRPINLEDKLMPYYRRIPEVIVKDSPRGLEGKIVESEEHSRLIGGQMIAFIDKGKKDGVQIGQIYNVYYQVSERLDPKKSDKTLLLPVDFAELLVLHTESTTATVLVTQTDREFEAGSKIRSPIR